MKTVILSIAVLTAILIGCGGGGMVNYATNIAGVRVEISADPGSMSNSACRKIMKQATGEMERLLGLLEAPGNLIDRINEGETVSAEGETVSAEGEMGLLLTALNDWQLAAGDLWFPPTLERLPDGRFRIDTTGIIDPDVFKYGWAVDAAASIMIQGNIRTAKIQYGGVYRFWGDTEPGKGWEITLPEYSDDSPVYTIMPQDGGLNIIDHNYNDAVTSEPKFEYVNHVSWAENALSACITGYFAQRLPLRQAMDWFNQRDDAGLLVRYPEGGDTSLETDRTLSAAVSILVP